MAHEARKLPEQSVPRPGPAPDPVPAPPPDTFEATFVKLIAGKGPDALIARYLENHGRWETQTHRGGGTTTELHVLVWCGCPICADARAYLKLED